MSRALVDRFLAVLGVGRARPDLAYLEALVAAHLRQVPYESFSKVLRLPTHGPRIPEFAEQVELMEEFGFGGTCFALNAHFVALLRGLGFAAELIGADSSGRANSHAVARVAIEGAAYIVDFGLCSTFAGPFPLRPGYRASVNLDWRRYEFAVNPDGRTYRIEILEGGKVMRFYVGRAEPVELAELAPSIRETYAPDAYFMRLLCAHRSFGDRAKVVWGSELLTVRGATAAKRALASDDEIERAVHQELRLSRYPVREALGRIRERTGTAQPTSCDR